MTDGTHERVTIEAWSSVWRQKGEVRADVRLADGREGLMVAQWGESSGRATIVYEVEVDDGVSQPVVPKELRDLVVGQLGSDGPGDGKLRHLRLF